jgi:glycosyltransferase involved in cell wall biosynthesis
MGLIPIEAACFGRASLGSNQGGVPEIVINNQTGLLVDPQNINEIKEAIFAFCSDNQLAAQLGKNARQLVEDKFNFNDFIALFETEMEKQL